MWDKNCIRHYKLDDDGNDDDDDAMTSWPTAENDDIVKFEASVIILV